MHGCSECTERDHIWSGMGIVPSLGPCVLRDSFVFRSRAPDAALSFVGPPTVGTRTQETGACRPAPPTSHTTPTTTSRPGSNTTLSDLLGTRREAPPVAAAAGDANVQAELIEWEVEDADADVDDLPRATQPHSQPQHRRRRMPRRTRSRTATRINHAYAMHELWMGACNIPAEWKVKRRACSGAVAMDGSVGERREARSERRRFYYFPVGFLVKVPETG